jgi:tetratricopeptide (TPR) repeat protein
MLDTGQVQLSGEALLWFRQGLAHASAKRYEQAVAAFGQVLESRADFYEAWYERALALEQCGDYVDAIANFDRALNLRPADSTMAEIWHDRGNALQYGLGDYVGAIDCYDQVLSLLPNHELAWLNRGNALLQIRDVTAALQCYQRTLSINPKNWLAWRNRGKSLVELEQYDSAIAAYRSALAIKPDDDISFHALNRLLERKGLGVYKEVTTHPVSTDPDFQHSTTVTEGDRGISPSKLTFGEGAFAIPVGQPMLVIEDDQGYREVLLNESHYQMGRDPSSDICLHSKFVSRHHAVLTRTMNSDGSTGYKIMDGDVNGRASTNGLLINAKKYRTSELCPEDVIVFGPGIQATYRLSAGT